MKDRTRQIDAYRSFLKGRRYSERTVRSYVMWIEQLSSYFPGRPLSALSQGDIAEFVSLLHQQRQLSAASRAQAHSALKSYFRAFLPDRNDLDFSTLSTPRPQRELVVIPTQKEVFDIIRAIDGQRNRVVVGLVYGMGLELGEALGLKVGDLNLDRRLADIKLNRKRGKTRKAYIPEMFLDDLEFLARGKKPGDFLFSGKSGCPVSTRTMQRALREAVAKAGLQQDFRFRSLRYAYIKHLEILGVPVVHTIEKMGLSLLSTLTAYTAISSADHDLNFSPADRIAPQHAEVKPGSNLPYVSENRIAQIARLSGGKHDFVRLVEILREINMAFSSESFLAIAMLVRSVMDHVPPVFNCKTFTEVANNYSGGKSFRNATQGLQQALRNVADKHLHTPIRSREALPEFEQVDFRAQLDLLLEEVVRLGAGN